MKKIIISVLFCFICISDLYARYNITEFLLNNGLRVILLEKKTSPIISFSIWYDCGSMCDAPSKSGVAHYLEHMAFCADKGVFDNFLENIGADRNAFTSTRTICFYEIVPSENIETVFKHEAARLKSIDIDKDKFISEKGAILEERSMRCDSNPPGQAFECLSANIFNRYPGGISIIGWKSEIESIEPQDLVDFYDKWFAPNNATIILAGDINIGHVKNLIEKYFGNIKAKKLPEKNKKYEKPKCIKEIKFSSPKTGSLSSVDYIYFVPYLLSSNFRKNMALKLAVQIINQPNFFAKKALEHSLNKATNLSFEYIKGYFQYDILIVSIVCSSVNNRVDSEKTWEYLKNKMHSLNINKADLDVVKRQELISMAYKNDDIKKISEYLGWMLSFGYSIGEIQSVDETIQSITTEECAEVLKEVLIPHPIGVLRIVPKGYDRD